MSRTKPALSSRGRLSLKEQLRVLRMAGQPLPKICSGGSVWKASVLLVQEEARAGREKAAVLEHICHEKQAEAGYKEAGPKRESGAEASFRA